MINCKKNNIKIARKFSNFAEHLLHFHLVKNHKVYKNRFIQALYMGTFINKGNEGFLSAINGEYVDKTGMIEIINMTLNTERRYTCVTRSRRFGKSMALDMLCAYYDKSCDSRQLFDGLTAQKGTTFDKHLNKYPVISLDITDFITKYKDSNEIISLLQKDVVEELLNVYPDIKLGERDDLMDVLCKINANTGEKFIVLIDEWDAICREFSSAPDVMDEYVKLLRRLFKGGKSKDVFAGAYMTGILPIKKFNTQSALNNFEEYSIIDPADLAGYFGFTPNEVEMLAHKYGRDVTELKKWYDGYQIGSEHSIYNPYSVDEAVYRGECSVFWKGTSSVYLISDYIRQDFEGASAVLDDLLNGGKYHIAKSKLDETLSSVYCIEHILIILIHLGYLTYNKVSEECYVPNKEVSITLSNTIEIIRMVQKAKSTHVR